MADAIISFDIGFGDIVYGVFVLGFKSLCKGTLNSLHLRKRNQCAICQDDVFQFNENNENNENKQNNQTTQQNFYV